MNGKLGKVPGGPASPGNPGGGVWGTHARGQLSDLSLCHYNLLVSQLSQVWLNNYLSLVYMELALRRVATIK